MPLALLFNLPSKWGLLTFQVNNLLGPIREYVFDLEHVHYVCVSYSEL